MVQDIFLNPLFNRILVVITTLKWAVDFLLHQSFFRHTCRNLGAVHSHSTTSDAECAVCLCRIEMDDEISELKCRHIFHAACFDRWIGYGHSTCPLCRNVVRTQVGDDNCGGDVVVHPQILVFSFCQIGTRNNETWWLR